MRRVLLLAGVISLGLWFGVDAKAESGQKKSTVEQGKSKAKLVTVTYSVADLVVPIAYNLDVAGDGKKAKATQEGALMRLICATVAPQSWEKVNAWDKADRQAVIEYYPLGMGLVVRQTKEVHEEIAALLAALRRLQDMQVAMDMRVISVPNALAPKILGTIDATHNRLVTLVKDEAQVRDMVETALKDSRTQILQTPKLTVFNGQRGTIQVGDTRYYVTGVSVTAAKNKPPSVTPNNTPIQVGVHTTVCPTISSDRQTVILDLTWEKSTIKEPVALKPIQVPLVQKNGETFIFQMFVQQPILDILHLSTKLGIPVGKTAIIEAGNEQRQTRVEDTGLTATVLEWVGIRGNVSYTTEACTTILLVTPRIISGEEHPEIFSRKVPASVRPQGN